VVRARLHAEQRMSSATGNIVIQGRLRWALTWWIFVVSAIAYLDRVNISIAGQFIQKDLNLDNTQLGWVFSAFVLGYALFQAPAGRLADRIGPRNSWPAPRYGGPFYPRLRRLFPADLRMRWQFSLV
jgi:sugar phosphate permease